ncbi:MAG: TraM recognition domain-containing protein [Ferruginibacter sp.]
MDVSQFNKPRQAGRGEIYTGAVNKNTRYHCAKLSPEFKIVLTKRRLPIEVISRASSTRQLKKDYSKDQADVIMNITGNVISGQVTGETAKQLSERFGKIMQDRASFSINRMDTSINRSKQLDSAIPPSKISALNSGEFVGMVADDPDCKIELKTFHSNILNDHDALKNEQHHYKPLPEIRKVDNGMVQRNYLQIKQDVEDLVNAEMEKMMGDPELVGLLVKREKV